MTTLKPLKNSEKNYNKIAVFDIESYDWINAYAIGLYYDEIYKEFIGDDCIKQFLEFVLTKKFRGYSFFAHNGGKFDFNFLLQNNLKDFEIDIIRSGSRLIQISFKKNKQIWKFKDSFCFLPFSLKKICKNFGTKTIKGEFEHEKVKKYNYMEFYSEWSDYLKNDCVSLYESINIFNSYIYNKYGISIENNITLAQLSMKIFRKNFLKIEIPNYSTKTEEDIRKSYYGGRTEVFKLFVDKANYYDINSLYPFVMHEYKFPISNPVFSTNFDIYTDEGIVFAEVETPENINIPVLPYRLYDKNKNYKLIFPKGKFKGWFCLPEIRLAKEEGYKINIIKGYKFECEYLFKEYVDLIYKEKQNSKKDSVNYIVSKLLLNSLYGKFGQKRETENIIFFPSCEIGLKPLDFFGEIPFFSEKKISKSKHILPAIASYVTSYARIELYKLLKNNDPIYCDTDSIITENVLHTSLDLGGLKKEDDVNKGYFLAPKMYAYLNNFDEEIVKCKGFSYDTFGYSNFEECYNNNYDLTGFKTSFKKFGGVFESLRREKSFLSLLDINKSIKNKYDKRIIYDKCYTKPIIIT